MDQWAAAGCVADWTGRFGSIDAATGHVTIEDDTQKKRWVGTPGMSSITAHLANNTPGVTVVSSRRVTGFEGGPGSDADATADGLWTVVHRPAGPGPKDQDGNPLAPTETRDVGFAAVVAADKQAASDRSRRVYDEPPPIESAAAPSVWDGMRAGGSTPSFVLMLTVTSAAGIPLFPFEGALVTGDDKVAWIANDSSKPGRPTHGAVTGPQCWVIQSTAEYAVERLAVKLTIPGTSPHQTMLDHVAEEMLGSVLELASKNKTLKGGVESPESPEVIHSVAFRWGMAFPEDGAFEMAAANGGCLSEPARKVVGCGDFCVSPKVEGAALSGAAAAAQVLAMLPPISAL